MDGKAEFSFEGIVAASTTNGLTSSASCDCCGHKPKSLCCDWADMARELRYVRTLVLGSCSAALGRSRTILLVTSQQIQGLQARSSVCDLPVLDRCRAGPGGACRGGVARVL
ncbi:hypothetical protein N656DRAFT_555989 [Canariomyces notabilis]|uniref:Uncharacterized protein n=1 Tax=Canariomyces notabilis TaxID=2074819 RepID=A0AAN6TI92_9PEZI|nr:hypothetical protein N656DRAFT_555989 [Canariomyces arenarius]